MVFGQFFLNLQVVAVISLLLSVFLGAFLFWRAGRRELVESQVLFDAMVVFGLGGILGGRVFDFLTRWDFYNWSLRKLFFFNAYWGFNFFGAFIGGLVIVWFYLRAKKGSFWFLFDLGASPLAFSAFVYFLVNYSGKGIWPAVGFFAMFWVLKRLEGQKRHTGFFACFFIVFCALVNLMLLILAHDITKDHYLEITFTLLGIAFGGLLWYTNSKRKLITDLRAAFAGALLFIFKLKRILTNMGEADSTAKAVILSPLMVVKGTLYLVKYVCHELLVSIRDFVNAFRVRR